MKNSLYAFFGCLLVTMASSVVIAESSRTKAKRLPNAHADSGAHCDDVARNLLATNAKNKIENSSTASDYKLKSTVNLGDASTSRVISIYTEPSDGSAYLLEFYGEGCALKALIHL